MRSHGLNGSRRDTKSHYGNTVKTITRRVKIEKIDPESWLGKSYSKFPYPMIATMECDDYIRGFFSDGTVIPASEWKLREHDIKNMITDLNDVLEWWTSRDL
jgi:hypothetical protein